MSFSRFLYELTDAKEHLENLIRKIAKDDECCEEAFRVDLGHVFAHLNRAWHCRDRKDDDEEAVWETISKFPTDLDPVG